MPDFDRLHELSRKLALLTSPGELKPGLASWDIFTDETWQQIAEMWATHADALAKARGESPDAK